MKKQLHILKGLFILTLIFILSLCLVTFTYKILHENVDTTYMWNINLTNLKIKEGSKKGNISIKDNKVTLDLTLKEENDFYEFTFDIENKGSLDASLDEYKLKVDNPKNIITYKINYLNDTPIKKGDILNNDSTQTIKVRIDYPKQEKKIYEELNIKISLSLKYVEK